MVNMKSFNRLTLFLIVSIAILSCSPSNDECLGVLDTTEIVESKLFKQTEYYLVRRVAGWHDKVEIIQLFNTKPQLDACNRDMVKPIFEDSLDEDRVFKELVVDLDKNLFNVKYNNGASTDSEKSKLRFIISSL